MGGRSIKETIMESAKKKIQQEVKIWLQTSPLEVEAFKKALAPKKDQDTLSTKWAELEGSDFIERHAYSMPTLLEQKILLLLTEEEEKWYRTKQGAEWMVKNYSIFAVTYKA